MAEKRRKKTDDIMHGRSFEGAEYAPTEREQTEDLERSRHASSDDDDDFVTDAEIEARELDSEDDGADR